MEVQVLASRLTSSDLNERRVAAEEIHLLGEEAQPAAVALVRCCADDDHEVREFVGSALEALGPPSASDIASLSELVGNTHSDVAYWAATLLGRLGRVRTEGHVQFDASVSSSRCAQRARALGLGVGSARFPSRAVGAH